MFDRLLYLSTVKELDLKKVLPYSLTSAPLTFAHIDGLKISTDISSLFSKLEVRIIIDAPKNVDICIFDEMFLIHSNVDLVPTFCGIANLTLFCLVKRAYW